MALNNEHTKDEASMADLAKIVESIQVGLLTTQNSKGELSTRPMKLVNFNKETGEISFFSDLVAQHTLDIVDNSKVNVAFASTEKNSFASLSGHAEIITNPEEKAKHWSALIGLWYQATAQSDDVVLIKVHSEKAEFWDAPSNKIVNFFNLAKSVLSGSRPSSGTHQVIELP